MSYAFYFINNNFKETCEALFLHYTSQSTAADCSVHLTESKTGSHSLSLDGTHTQGLNDCIWIRESLLATASDDGNVVLWDVETVNCLLD